MVIDRTFSFVGLGRGPSINEDICTSMDNITIEEMGKCHKVCQNVTFRIREFIFLL